MDSSSRHLWQRSNIRIVIICVLIFASLYLIDTVVLPLARGDGLASYTGVQRQVAERALDSERHLLLGMSERFGILYHIDSVRPTSSKEVELYCKPHEGSQLSVDPQSMYYYTVTLSSQELFSFRRTTKVYDGCYFLTLGDKPGGARQ